MPRVLIATDQPNQYPTGTLAKCGNSLRELARQTPSIPIVWGSHNGKQAGVASGLEYRDDDGIGKLYALVSHRIPAGWGASLQYSGEVIGNTIRVIRDRGLHLAIVPNPRDTRTIYADNNMAYQIFRDSAEGGDEPTPAPTQVIDPTPAGPVTVETPVATEPPVPGDAIEIPAGALDALLSNSQFIDRIAAGVAKHLTPAPINTPAPTETPAPQPPATPPIVYRVPAPTQSAPPPRPSRPVQHRPKALN